jgi:hypothetical protein
MAGKLQIYADRMEVPRSAQGNLRDFWALDNEIAERFRRKKRHEAIQENVQ